MAQTHYKLHYFDSAGRGEPIRMAFRLQNIDFEDERINYASWPTLKEKYPFGTVPVLEVNGVSIAQSNAILSYVGKLGGLYPSDPFLGAQVDEIMAGVEDIMVQFGSYRRETDPEKKKAIQDELTANVIPKSLGFLEKLHETRQKGTSPYFIGDKLTVADLKVWNLISLGKSGRLFPLPGVFEKFPRLTKMWEAVNVAVAKFQRQ